MNRKYSDDEIKNILQRNTELIKELGSLKHANRVLYKKHIDLKITVAELVDTFNGSIESIEEVMEELKKSKKKTIRDGLTPYL